MEQHSAMKKGKPESSVGKWLHPESMKLSEINQSRSFNITWLLLHRKPKI